MLDPHKVILVEDDPDFIYLIQQAIQQCAAISFLGAARYGGEGIALAQKLRPRVVLMDLNLPGGIDGVAAARTIRLTTEARVLLLTSCEDYDTIICASRQAFASGYVFKSQCQTLADVICRTAETSTPQAAFIRELVLSALSPAERSIVEMLLKDELTLSSAKKTIANQKTSIFRKLGLHSTAELLHIFRHW
jgi:DNA-binding NarL/FixJ family response regulator